MFRVLACLFADTLPQTAVLPSPLALLFICGYPIAIILPLGPSIQNSFSPKCLSVVLGVLGLRFVQVLCFADISQLFLFHLITTLKSCSDIASTCQYVLIEDLIKRKELLLFAGGARH